MSNEAITSHLGIAVPMLEDNINTDLIIPSREMKRVSKKQLADGLFANHRYQGGPRVPNPDFILNMHPYQSASVLLAGQNMGCGSSREHAVWALKDFGFRAVLAGGFASIFRNNCVANGIIPATLEKNAIVDLAKWTGSAPEVNLVTVDLENRQVRYADKVISFSISETEHEMLTNGHSLIDVTLRHHAKIGEFAARDRKRRTWIYDQTS